MRPYLQIPFEAALANAHQLVFNIQMASSRISVEWNYKDLKQMWATNDFSRLLKVRQFPVAMLYRSSAILLNMRTCHYGGGQTGSYFGCDPPTLDEYVNSD